MIAFVWMVAVVAISKTINHIPGVDGPLPSTWHSGFVDTSPAPNGKSSSTHFLLMEAETNPKSAPLLIWMQGGPGASSLYGLFIELGQVLLNSAATSSSSPVIKPQVNPFAWTKFANVLTIDFPPPVGFSFCGGDPAGDPTSCGPWNDTSTALHNVKALTGIISRELPWLAKLPLFVTGESYAGVYVPMVVDLLLSNGIAVQGVAVGDGCAGAAVLCGRKPGPFQMGGGIYYDLLFFYGHAQTSQRMFDDLMSVCGEKALRSGDYASSRCRNLVDLWQKRLGQFYTYNLYDSCSSHVFGNLHKTAIDWGRPLPMSLAGAPRGGARLDGFVCPGDAFDNYLASAEVRTALGVAVNSNFFNADNGNGFVYHTTKDSVLDIYSDILNNGSRLLLYQGDADPAINVFVTQDLFLNRYFVNEPVDEEWRPWAVTSDDSYTQGYVQYWRDGRAQYATVRGSGHQVPEFKPEAAFFLMKSFVTNKRLPEN